MASRHNLKVLIAPLDWGLGHTTRCIPLIKHLEDIGCTLFLAGDGDTIFLLKSEFPNQNFLQLKGYKISYTNNKRLLPFKILYQLPKVLIRIYKEHLWLKKIVKKISINLIISDNRFGLWHPLIPSIFLTHQLQIKGPNKWVERILLHLNYQHINRFTHCWVPDFKAKDNIAGSLSHPVQMPGVPVTYIGPLSRFNNHTSLPILYKLCLVISGPEPQRGIFEQLLLKELQHFNHPVLLVRGLPAADEKQEAFNQVTIANHLPATQLEAAFLHSEYIVARAGYTTIMDVIKMHKKAILVPTPGQTEQEYLALYLHEKQVCFSMSQQHFNLQNALQQAQSFAYKIPALQMDLYKNVIDETISSIAAGTYGQA